jgi:hypothetical protein
MSKVKRGQIICMLADLLFPVELRENPRRTNSEYKKVVVGTLTETIALTKREIAMLKANDDSNTSTTKEEAFEIDLNYCSNRYELVPNAVIFPNIEKILKLKKIEYTVQYSHTSNARFYANYVITDKRYRYKIKGTNDEICPVLRVQHSYNGLTKYRIMFGYFRVICSNGLTVPVQEMSKYNLVIIGKHTSSILRSLKQLDTLLSQFANEAKQITADITEKFEMLASRSVVDVKARVEQVLRQNKIGMVDNKNFNTVENIANRILAEANGDAKIINFGSKQEKPLGYDGKVNDWLVYNGINQYLGDDSVNIASPEKRMETDTKIFEYMLKNAA